MAKTLAETNLGKALRDIDVASIVYKPPDDARNWKPCDYMVWIAHGSGALSTWFEVKDVDLVNVFPRSEIRPSQVRGIRDATRVGIPYYLCVWFRKASMWAIADAAKVMGWFDENPDATSIKRELLQSRFGVDATNHQLTSVLKSIVLEGVA